MSENVETIKSICQNLKVEIEKDETVSRMIEKISLMSREIAERERLMGERYQEELKREIRDEAEMRELDERYGYDNWETNVFHRVEKSQEYLDYINQEVEKEYLRELREIRGEQESKKRENEDKGKDNLKKLKTDSSESNDSNSN
jgi:hypothetical protein